MRNRKNSEAKPNGSALGFEAQLWAARRRPTGGEQGMSTPFPIPMGLHPSAQGCRVGEATLGNVFHYSPQPQRGCINPLCAGGFNPFRVVEVSEWFPRVARSEPDVPTSQPWAEWCDPVGVNKCRAVSSGELHLPL
jgi:hypothetical protein